MARARARGLAGRSALALAATALAAGALAGCGGSGSSERAAVTSASASAPPQTSTVYGSSEAPAVAARRASLPQAGPTASGDGPLPPSAFRRPVAQYKQYVGRQLGQMQQDVAALTAAMQRGDRQAARSAWGDADADYMRVGAAYGSFGTLDERIDGTPSGKPKGVDDPSFRGLHRVEHALWNGADPRVNAVWSERLAGDVARLRTHVRRLQIAAPDYAIRAHEILEDAQRDLLSGTRLPWSGQGVRATSAALDATVTVIETLRPLVGAREDALVPVDVGIAGLRRALADVRRAHGGGWPTVAQLSVRERARL
ncbi:MAG TPA: EfeM/EfeO family lipoprotein, partial [Conexibacter sp.]